MSTYVKVDKQRESRGTLMWFVTCYARHGDRGAMFYGYRTWQQAMDAANCHVRWCPGDRGGEGE